MKDIKYTILSNEALTRDVYRMVLEGDTSECIRPGQFIEIRIPGRYLRRPISICDYEEGKLTIIYKVVGEGTMDMSTWKAGQSLEALCALGNGYDVAAAPDQPVVTGGGVGVPPMYALTKALLAAGKHPRVALGFNTKDEIFYEEEFKALGVPVSVTTVDGSYGTRGFVTSVLENADYAFCCGPEPMLKAVHQSVHGGQFSFETRMGCGFGACMGCSRKMKSGYKRICKDGPIFPWEDIQW